MSSSSSDLEKGLLSDSSEGNSFSLDSWEEDSARSMEEAAAFNGIQQILSKDTSGCYGVSEISEDSCCSELKFDKRQQAAM